MRNLSLLRYEVVQGQLIFKCLEKNIFLVDADLASLILYAHLTA